LVEYSVSIKSSAIKELERLPSSVLVKVFAKIEGLKEDPGPVGSVKLVGADLFRLRQGDYRIVYTVDDEAAHVEVLKIGHRSDD